MKRYLLAAAALAAITSPAAARDGSAYVGVEGGLLWPHDMDFDLRGDGDVFDEELEIDYKRGLDLDVIAGYDFGMVRAEAELAWKRAKIDDVTFDEFDDDDDFDDTFGRTSVLSLMGNVLADFGGNDSWGAYAGGGFGRARVKLAGNRDTAWAWQIIAGVRTAVSPNVDVGLKYRYFNSGRLSFGDEELAARGRFRSHSLLASLIFNFGAPAVAAPAYVPVAAPPPPPPPATQTCPDGTVILATEMCPAPPPPPPPPPPAPERG